MFRTSPSIVPSAEGRKTRLGGQVIAYTIKRSARARHARLEVRVGTGLTVVIPRTYKEEQIPELLGRKRDWILEKLKKYGKVAPLPSGKETGKMDSIPYLGRDLPIIARCSRHNTSNIKLERNQLVVSVNPESGRLNLVLERWYRLEAEKLIKEKVDELCPRLGVTYNRLSIRGARTRWGSCSQKGNINFNWKLMMVPEPVIDYVVIHELAHLKEMNHSKRFWKLVAEHCPQWHRHRQWLKDHEAELATRLPS